MPPRRHHRRAGGGHPPSRRLTGWVAALAASAVVSAVAVVGLPVPPARAADGQDVDRRGSCSGPADWRLKVQPHDGRLEVEGRVDSTRVGQRWRWRIAHNGSVSARGTRRTAGSSESFRVERTLVDLSGRDRIVFRSTHAGQKCRGVVNF